MSKKVVIVTGGANGIGKCLVEAFAKRGDVVCFIDKDLEAGNKLLQQLSGEHLFYAGDLAKQQHIEGFVKKVIETFNKVDILINNACFSHKGIISGCTYEQFNEVLQVGVTAPYMFTQLLLPYFQDNASIVNIASTRALQSQANTESYSAAKGGILSLTHALAVSLAGKVRVNAISPGWIQTDDSYMLSQEDKEQHLSRRVGTPDDIVRAVLFLTDENNDFINGENIVIDGGMSKLMIYHGDSGWNYRK